MTNQERRLLLFPLQVELDHFIAHCKHRGLQFDKQQYQGKHFFLCKEKPWILACCGLGKTQAGIQSQFFIDNLKGIQSLILLGGAGALSPDLNIGDCVMANQIVEHDFPNTPSHSATELTAITYCNIGVIASGDENITTRKRANELREKTGALAVAWESAGVARTAKFNGLVFSELRVVTDSCSGNIRGDFENNINQGMQKLAAVLTDQLH